MVKIAPSLLSANFAVLKEDIDSISAAGAHWLHYDVMDGHFVPNISFGYSILKDVRKVTDLFLDVHLMISEPARYIDEFAKNGADLITVHLEAFENEADIHAVLKQIHDHHIKAGLSIKPATSVDALLTYLKEIDVVLVMSVEPGFGGQSFMPDALDKIAQLKAYQKDYDFLIEVDGGINADTGHQCSDQGADVLVAGSYIFNAEDRHAAIASLL